MGKAEILGLWKPLQAVSRVLMGHPTRSLEDSGAESSVGYRGRAQELSERIVLATELEPMLARS